MEPFLPIDGAPGVGLADTVFGMLWGGYEQSC